MQKLTALSSDIVHLFRLKKGSLGKAPYAQYEGFGMWDLHGDADMQELIRRHSCPETTTIQLVVAKSDERVVHVHDHTDVVVTVLNGILDTLPDLIGAEVYDHGCWRPVRAGEVIQIPRGTPHDFACIMPDTLYFMAVQNASIVLKDGTLDHRFFPIE